MKKSERDLEMPFRGYEEIEPRGVVFDLGCAESGYAVHHFATAAERDAWVASGLRRSAGADLARMDAAEGEAVCTCGRPKSHKLHSRPPESEWSMYHNFEPAATREHGGPASEATLRDALYSLEIPESVDQFAAARNAWIGVKMWRAAERHHAITGERAQPAVSDGGRPRPCPFCGSVEAPALGSARDHGDDDDEDDYFAVCCSVHEGGCGATGGYAPNEHEAVANWNRRPC
jgi:hypothetical protein